MSSSNSIFKLGSSNLIFKLDSPNSIFTLSSALILKERGTRASPPKKKKRKNLSSEMNFLEKYASLHCVHVYV
jgi:hypothetical protein